MDEFIAQQLQKAGLLDYFNSLPLSHQKEYLQWINAAKKEETKTKRIARMIEMLRAKQN